jgi:hypothetical protein
MKRGKIIRENWYYVFLLIFFVFVVMGFLPYIHTEKQISHFNEWAIGTKDDSIKTLVAITGEYKTEGEGFVVGERITICAAIFVNEYDFKELKIWYESTGSPRLMFIENSENPEESGNDICENFEHRNFDDCYVNKGTLDIVKFRDQSQTIMVKGDVIFTKEGKLSFTTANENNDPIGFLLNKYGIKETGVYVAPRYVKYQIEANKRMESLSCITVAIAFLALFLTFYRNRPTI